LNPNPRNPPRSLAQLLLRRVLLAYVLFAVVIAGLQVALQARQARADILAELRSVARSSAPGLAEAEWNVQAPLLDALVRGIGTHAAVVRVEVQGLAAGDPGVTWQVPSGQRPEADLSIEQPLVYADVHGARPVGSLRIASGQGVLRARVAEILWSLAVSDAALFVCLGLLLWWLARRFVVRPLVDFTEQVGALSASAQGRPIDLGRAAFGEIATLQLGFNELMGQLAQSHAQIAHQNAQLEREQRQVRSIIDAIPDLIFIKDTEGRYIGCNRAFLGFAGRSEAEVLGRIDQELFAAADADVFRARDEAALAAGSLRFEEAPVRYPDGRTVYLETQKSRVVGADGKVLGLVGISRDTTRRRALEEENRLASLVYRNSSEAMMATDEEGRIIAINPAFTEITGYTGDEVLGRHPKFLVSARHDSVFLQRIGRSLHAEGRWAGEMWSRRRDGAEVAVWVTLNTIYGGAGGPHRRVALFSDISEKKKADNLIWTQANYDYLTGLPNRRLFQDRLDQEIRKAHREHYQVAVLFIDLDRFKEVNDSLGHEVGDLLLVEAAARIQERIRGCDTLSRFGGDEFTVILPELREVTVIGRISMAIIERLSEPFVLEGQESFVSASVGIALYPDDAASVTDLVKQADQAMYAAKSAGRGRFNYFTRALQQASEQRLRLAADLRRALKESQFELYYQPIVELAGGTVRKAEALLRWRHPALGFVSPAVFIPVAEDTGAIQELGDWVFHEASAQLRAWQARLGPHFQVSVNMSPAQFQRDARPHERWIERLRELGLPGANLVIEITERLLMSGDAEVAEVLLGLRDAGVQVAIDDFGTGYSALSYLKKFDIDYLKIDQSFTRNLTPTAPDLALCEAIVVMAHKLGLRVIAEGVETAQQRDLLRQIGCDYAQGYLFARPVPVAEFEALLAAGVEAGALAQGCQSS
jgi:diguanylate cyclase (GGDEF)-like protein/PAS domain S-box-containing protein